MGSEHKHAPSRSKRELDLDPSCSDGITTYITETQYNTLMDLLKPFAPVVDAKKLQDDDGVYGMRCTLRFGKEARFMVRMGE